MDIKEHTQPAKLERYSFLWSEVRLVIAAVALLLGGIPPALYLLPIPALYGLIIVLLKLAWIVSGAASAYLLYRWYIGGRKVFGGNDMKDNVAFFVSVISGINLGIVGLLGTNIGMSITSNYIVFVIVALLYLAAAYQLYTRWKSHGEKIS
ncbi:MAG: hypothetical protein G01um10148_255 [Parcubacteria group bacterium Gr01-1014_8]|nr:MAG: hypothetical protein G01um10148_255 [Parcubacteria group bacterium Gr01-1014_8]